MSASLPYASRPVLLPPRDIGRPFLIAIAILLGAWFVGALTNLVNGWVSLEYFQWVLPRKIGNRWDVVGQGLFEATFAGAGVCLIVLPFYCGATGCRYPVTRFAWFLGMSLALAMGCHVLFGLAAVAIAALDPKDFFVMVGVYGYPDSPLRFAYVCGAIWGSYAGGLLTVVICCVGTYRGWRSLLRRAAGSGSDAVLVR